MSSRSSIILRRFILRFPQWIFQQGFAAGQRFSQCYRNSRGRDPPVVVTPPTKGHFLTAVNFRQYTDGFVSCFKQQLNKDLNFKIVITSEVFTFITIGEKLLKKTAYNESNCQLQCWVWQQECKNTVPPSFGPFTEPPLILPVADIWGGVTTTGIQSRNYGRVIRIPGIPGIPGIPSQICAHHTADCWPQSDQTLWSVKHNKF